MNDITKNVVKRILELNIEGVRERENGSLWYRGDVMVGAIGDVNFWSWHDRKLQHDYFKFTDQSGSVYIETQERADEFVNIVANHFSAKKITRSERLQRVYDDVLNEIVEELTKEHNGNFAINGCSITNDNKNIASITEKDLHIIDDHYFEDEEQTHKIWVDIDDVKVRKAFNVAEELCKIKLYGKLKLTKTNANRVILWWGSCRIGSIYNGFTGKTASELVVGATHKIEMNQRFGEKLKPEQGKEYVKFIAEVLGGEYNV